MDASLQMKMVIIFSDVLVEINQRKLKSKKEVDLQSIS